MKAMDDFKRFFTEGNNMVRKIIVVNVMVFLLANLVALGLWVGDDTGAMGSKFLLFTGLFAVPADLSTLIIRPWTIITYAFFHVDFFHILFNMLFLYWLGSIFREYLGNSKTLSTYIWGGIFGAGLYLLAFNTIPALRPLVPDSIMFGASAGVLAVVVGICAFLPYYEVSLFNFFVSLRWVGVFIVIMDIISIPKGNPGGHIAHLGGALYGFLYARHLRKSSALGTGIESIGNFFGRLFKRKSKLTVIKKETTLYSSSTIGEFDDEYEPNQEEIDAILDKISQSGYESLTRKERELLYKASKQH